jgi:magnesium transporter
MVTEFVRYRENATIAGVVHDIRVRANEYRDYDVQYIYVCDYHDRLTGVLRVRDLLLGDESRPLGQLMIRNPLAVRADASLDELVEQFDRTKFLGIPVTDANGKLLGIVKSSAVAEARQDRQESQLLKMQGIPGGEEIRTMPLFTRSSRRLSWLTINIVLNVIAASVIAMFEHTLSSVIALAVFLPIISDMSGCSGNQAVAVSMRELSLGLIRPRDLFRVWWQEISIGLINGVCLGALIAVVAIIWKGNPYLGLVVGLALCLNTMIAVSIGGAVPLILKRMGADPAIASGPILTTITDMCGFLFVLGIATLMLDYL